MRFHGIGLVIAALIGCGTAGMTTGGSGAGGGRSSDAGMGGADAGTHDAAAERSMPPPEPTCPVVWMDAAPDCYGVDQ